VADDLAVVANTGDDIEIYGVHVSPDPDLVTYWLADAIDERGYGIRGDTFREMEALERAGKPTWFRLGDRDLEMCRLRTEQLRAGRRLTEAHAAVVDAMGVEARVLPMCDAPVATDVTARGRTLPFQEFMVRDRAEGPVEGVELRGVESARPTPEVLATLAEAEAIVIGPSNPVISIGPILAVPGMREAIAGSPAPVVAVSPFVGGRALKGPTELFCEFAGIEPRATGVVRAYADLLDGLVADEVVDGIPCRVHDTVMDSPESRTRVAAGTLELARSLYSRD
jgi:LPPG:FO 2-phospho-L-lactate transferase